MFLDNTACNLASVNLRRFFDEETNGFDVQGFENTCRLWTVVLEISVLMAQFPSKEWPRLSYDYRTRFGLYQPRLHADGKRHRLRQRRGRRHRRRHPRS